MAWPSAELLAEIHARVLARAFDCDVQVTPGDLGATASSMGSTGQPAVAPEMWASRVADVWNAGIEAQIQTATLPNGQVWHRVRVGPFSNQDELNKSRAALKENKLEANLIKVRE